jgi:hypothetical protein
LSNIKEYQPTFVKLPDNLKKKFTEREWKEQLEHKKNDPTYDDYSLFYDVFFDSSKETIWTVGPPLLSLEKEIFPIKISYQGEPLRYKYHRHIGPYYHISFFEIAAENIKEKNPVITFSGKSWKLNTKVSSFPSNTALPTLSVIQKDYSAEHIIDWILWHYCLHQFRKFFIYDNQSKNIQEVIKALKKLQLPDLEVIIIHWHYYFGPPDGLNTRFAQISQLNHSLKLHSNQKCCVANWDMDEYLISNPPSLFQNLSEQEPHLHINCYNTVDVEAKPPSSIRDCIFRKKIQDSKKYFYYSDKVDYLFSPHKVVSNETPVSVFSFYYSLRRYLFFVNYFLEILKKGIRQLLRLWRGKKKQPQNIYLIHAFPIKITWKISRTKEQRPFREAFDPKIHIKDKNIQEHLERAKFVEKG